MKSVSSSTSLASSQNSKKGNASSSSSKKDLKGSTSASIFMQRYETMVDSQLAEEDKTTEYLRPLYDQLVRIGYSDGKSGKRLTYAQCARALQDNGLFKTDEQLMLILKELSAATSRSVIKEEEDDNEKCLNGFLISDDDLDEGISFTELLHCYRIVVVGMLALDQMRIGSVEREHTKQRCMQMIRSFLPTSANNRNSSLSNQDRLPMDEVKQILTAKDWQLVHLIDEHAAELDDIADLIVKGKRAHSWVLIFRSAVMFSLFLMGIGVYAYNNGLLPLLDTSSSQVDTKIAGNEEFQKSINITNETETSCKNDLLDCKSRVLSLGKDKREGLQTISSLQKDMLELHNTESRISASLDNARQEIAQYRTKVSESSRLIESLEQGIEKCAVAEKECEKVKNSSRAEEKKLILLEIENKELQSSASLCREHISYLERDIKNTLSRVDANADSLKLCLTQLNEKSSSMVISQVKGKNYMQNQNRKMDQLLNIGRYLLIGSLVAVALPIMANGLALTLGTSTGRVVTTSAAARGTARVMKASKAARGSGFLSNLFNAVKGVLDSTSSWWTSWFRFKV